MGHFEHALIKPIRETLDDVIPKLTKGIAEGQARYAEHLRDAADAFEHTDRNHVSISLDPVPAKGLGKSKTGDVSTGPREADHWDKESAKHADVSTAPGTAVFWTGRTRTGPQADTDWVGAGEDATGRFRAGELAKLRGKTTLEGVLDDRHIPMPTWSADPAVRARWTDVSKQYAAGVSGPVHVVMGRSVRQDAIWHEEFKALKANSNVTSITKIDLTTGRESVIYQQAARND